MSDDIDFSGYSLKELYEARDGVARERYPKNAEQIDKLIAMKEAAERIGGNEKDSQIEERKTPAKLKKDIAFPDKDRSIEKFRQQKKFGFLREFVSTIKLPIIVATIINIFSSALPMTPIWILGFNIIVSVFCIMWAGYIAYSHLNKSLMRASFAGPILGFVAFFLVTLFSVLISQFRCWISPAISSGTEACGKPAILLLLTLIYYFMFFPITMLISCSGAIIAKKTITPSNKANSADAKNRAAD